MKGFNIHRAYAIARKEVMHILRDPFTLTLALGLPVMLVTFFGYAIDYEVKNISLAVSDRDNGPASRRLISHSRILNPLLVTPLAISIGENACTCIDGTRALTARTRSASFTASPNWEHNTTSSGRNLLPPAEMMWLAASVTKGVSAPA